MIAVKRAWPFVPEVRLYHSAEKAMRHMNKHGIDAVLIEGSGAQTWYNEENTEAVVLVTYKGDTTDERALLVHEAVHVVLTHYDKYLGEDEIGDEFMAYGVQVVSHGLLSAHDRWRKGRATDDKQEKKGE